jgi:hypothetical protein
MLKNTGKNFINLILLNIVMNFFFFDYIYYRIARAKFKTQGPLSATAIGFISIMQALLIELIIDPIFTYLLSENDLITYSKQLAYLAGLIGIILMFINYKVYAGKYEKFDMQWKDENRNTRIFKGICIFLSMILPVILFTIESKLVHK